MFLPYVLHVPHFGAISVHQPEEYESWMLKCSRMIQIKCVEDEQRIFRTLSLFRYFDVVEVIRNLQKSKPTVAQLAEAGDLKSSS